MAIRLTGSQGTWVLPEGETLFGRSTQCGICLLDARLSRRHAGFHVQGSRLKIRDLGSTNGVLVNGKPVLECGEAQHGDQVVVGPCLLTVRIDDTLAPDTVTSLTATLVHEPSPWEAAAPPSRHLNPQIAAAIAPGSDLRQHESETETHQPSDSHHPDTKAVVRHTRESLIANEERAAILAVVHESAATVHGEAPLSGLSMLALQLSASASRGRRLVAGLLDGLQISVVSLLLAAPIAVLGYVLALRQAGAGLSNGLPSLAVLSETPVPLGVLAASLLHDGGLAQALYLAGQLRGTPFLILYLAIALSALVFLLTHLLGTVMATVRHGGPWWHRRLGLNIIQLSTNAAPSWEVAWRRWSLLLLFWPLAALSLARGQDGPHDRWSGCVVRKL